MVTAKREIKTEEERWGGYAPKAVRTVVRPASAACYREYSSNDEFLNESYDERADSGILRRSGQAQVRVQPVEEPERIKPPTMPQRKVFEPEDEDALYPSDAAARNAREQETLRPQPRTRQRARLNTRGKAILIGYAVVVVALLAVIIINAVAISGISASVSALNGEVLAAQQAVAEREIEKTNVSSPQVPSDMVQAGAVEEIALPVPAAPAPFVPETSWFEKFCSFLSGIFGG